MAELKFSECLGRKPISLVTVLELRDGNFVCSKVVTKAAAKKQKLQTPFLAPTGPHLSEINNQSTRDQQPKRTIFGHRN